MLDHLPELDPEPELMPATNPEPMPSTECLEPKQSVRSDQVYKTIHISVPVGILVELGEEIGGNIHLTAAVMSYVS